MNDNDEPPLTDTERFLALFDETEDPADDYVFKSETVMQDIAEGEDTVDDYCAKALQSLPNPRDLLRAVADKHPDANEEQLHELFQEELEFHPDVQKAITIEVIQRLHAEESSEGRA